MRRLQRKKSRNKGRQQNAGAAAQGRTHPYAGLYVVKTKKEFGEGDE